MRPPCKRRAGKCLLVRQMKSRRDSGKVRGVDVGGLKLSSSEREREKERWRKRERGWGGGGGGGGGAERMSPNAPLIGGGVERQPRKLDVACTVKEQKECVTPRHREVV
jgi:hypothetical protein